MVELVGKAGATASWSVMGPALAMSTEQGLQEGAGACRCSDVRMREEEAALAVTGPTAVARTHSEHDSRQEGAVGSRQRREERHTLNWTGAQWKSRSVTTLQSLISR